jgi:hypothetical protein
VREFPTAVDAAIVAAAIAVAGTLGAQYLAGWREERRERRRSNDARIDDLRAVLDEAAQALMLACDAHRELERAITRDHGQGKIGRAFEDYEQALAHARRHGPRLAVRLGEYDPLHDVYDRAVSHVADSRSYFVALIGRTDDEAAETIKTVQSDRGAALVGQERFHMRAAALVGPRLDHPSDEQPAADERVG